MLIRNLASVLPLMAVVAACSSTDSRAVTSATPGITSAVAANNDFAWKLYGAASAKTDGNLFFSPFSVSSAFGMTLAGANGDTAAEMRAVFAVQGDEAAYHKALGALLRDLGGSHPGRSYELDTANRLFGQKATPFAPAFLSLVGTDYGAPLDAVDFGDTSATVSHINSWANLETKGKIPTIVDDTLVTPDTRLVVANAVYFKASWSNRFDPAATKPEPFHMTADHDVTVPMMHRSGKGASSAGNADVSLLDLDYQGDELSMVILMPNLPADLPSLEKKLNRAYVDDLISHERAEDLDDLALPKWQIGEELPLKALLQDLGMVKAFDSLQADFSRMLDPNQGHLYLSFAVHKAFASVDEQGTEAAAVTASGAVATAFLGASVDRPFVYLIRDRMTGAILFMGRMVDPTDHGTF